MVKVILRRQASLLAYLPQHIAEVGGVAILIGVLVGVLPALATGRISALPHWPTGRVRLLALGGIVGAGVVALLSFVTDAEPSGGLPQGHWGSHTDRVSLVVWLALIAAIAAWNLIRELRFLSRPPTLASGGTRPLTGYTQRFVGGMRSFHDVNAEPRFWSWGANATWPLAELLIDEHDHRVGVRLRSRWLRTVIPDWSAPLDAITCEPFGRTFTTRGVLIRSPGQPPVIFWCGKRGQQDVLAALVR